MNGLKVLAIIVYLAMAICTTTAAVVTMVNDGSSRNAGALLLMALVAILTLVAVASEWEQ